MKKILVLSVLIVIVLVLLCSCSNTLTATTVDADHPEYMYIRVESNTDTGTFWDYEIVDEDLIKYVDVLEDENLNTDITGDNFAQKFVFEAIDDGTGTVIMEKYEKDSSVPIIIQKYHYDISDGCPVLVDIEDSDKENAKK